MYTFSEDNNYSENSGNDIKKLLYSSTSYYKEKPKLVVVKKEPEPIRGLGRYRPDFEKVGYSINYAEFLREPGPVRGLGRNLNFYPKLYHFLKQISNKTINLNKKSYNYWRGRGKPTA
jgi:hypothetical protein